LPREERTGNWIWKWWQNQNSVYEKPRSGSTVADVLKTPASYNFSGILFSPDVCKHSEADRKMAIDRSGESGGLLFQF